MYLQEFGVWFVVFGTRGSKPRLAFDDVRVYSKHLLFFEMYANGRYVTLPTELLDGVKYRDKNPEHRSSHLEISPHLARHVSIYTTVWFS